MTHSAEPGAYAGVKMLVTATTVRLEGCGGDRRVKAEGPGIPHRGRSMNVLRWSSIDVPSQRPPEHAQG